MLAYYSLQIASLSQQQQRYGVPPLDTALLQLMLCWLPLATVSHRHWSFIDRGF